jgi:hypothetical protein
LVLEHFQALEADFLHYYKTDLRQALWGHEKVGVRRLAALVHGLPPTSAVFRANSAAWDDETELAAVQVELTHSLLRTLIAVNSKKGAQLPDPLRIPRPWDLPKIQKRGTSMAELRSILKGGDI